MEGWVLSAVRMLLSILRGGQDGAVRIVYVGQFSALFCAAVDHFCLPRAMLAKARRAMLQTSGYASGRATCR